MSMSACSNIDIGFRHTQTIGKLFGLPVPKYIEKENRAVLTANEVRRWCEFNTEHTIENVIDIGSSYRYSVVGLSDISDFETGILALNQLAVIVAVMSSDAQGYIYRESNKCPQGKGRRDALRKASRRYRFSFN